MRTPTVTTQTHRIDGHTVSAHVVEAPLDHAAPDGPRIEVFAREFVRDGGEDRPRLLFLQGGPGHRSPRPDLVGGWLDRALEDHRVVLLDQRGTGLSSPVNASTLGHLTPAEQAAHLGCFRADAIVADAEVLRAALGGDPWSLLGQSFGGFVATCYLSRAPHGLREVYVTAGLPGLRTSADDVYRATYRQTLRRNEEFFARYPGDLAVTAAVSAHLDGEVELLPTGERLSSRRFRQLGTHLGATSRFDALHLLLEEPFTTVRGTRRLREEFLLDVGPVLSFAGAPLYAALHESIYAQGAATHWSAQRVRAEFDEFALDAGGEFRFTGEHVYPWQFEEDPALRWLREAAELLAARTDWPALYDPEALAHNEVPLAAAVYVEDMFVPYEFSAATARAVRGARTYVTNEHHHDGLRLDGSALLDKLIALRRR
ncbi:alpha/beta fold hydrolase [Kineococcus rubinsiae]|uniref:alpha/beta fold hydrolase n=1 Tax=Kineococcus rubinsiae TaxID=2609562 RepID=UPI001430BE93|nr:alpha/beta fold hydrolase [Kineococcus rubinsiae]NIZ92607.1 alpha/beta hydrolase [Kineococcus rubinsiae]